MALSPIGIFGFDKKLKNLIEQQLKPHYKFIFFDSMDNAEQLLKTIKFQCLIVHPQKNQTDLSNIFDELFARHGFIRILFVGQDGDYFRTKSCIETTGIPFIHYNNDDDFVKTIQEAIAHALFVPQIVGVANNSTPRIKRALEYINQNFTKIKSAEEVSANLRYANSTFLNEFRKVCQLSFRDYLTNLKIQYAQYLSKFPTLKAKKIAHLCGYTSEFNFFRIFKNKMGMTFAEFRKQSQKNI